MSEIEQLNKQKEELENNLGVLKNWTELKKRLNKKYKSPSDAYKALLKEGKDSLSVEDFAEFSKDLDLQSLFKDTKLNEENFSKCWEQWEYQAKQNEHKLQIINEKLQLLSMLEEKEVGKDGNKAANIQKNKKILNLIQNCENLDELKDKLETLVQGTQAQKDPQDVIQNEQECFSDILSKKSEIKDPELQIKKIQPKQQPSEVQSEAPQPPQQKKTKTTYLNNQNTKLQKSNISLNVTNTNSSLQISRLSQANQNKQSYIFDSQVQISPQKGQQQLKNPPVTPKQSLSSPNEEKESERRSHKSNRMRQDLSNYISNLFQGENTYKEPRQAKFRQEYRQEYRQEPQAQQRSLSGFPNLNKYYKNQQQTQQFREKSVDLEADNIFKRVQNIRYKLDDFQNQKLNQLQSQPRPIRQERTPERQTRLSQQKPKLNSRKSSPSYVPGNTHRLNLDKLKQEKEQQSTTGSTGQEKPKPQEQQQKQPQNTNPVQEKVTNANPEPETGFMSMDQLNSTLKGDQQANP